MVSDACKEFLSSKVLSEGVPVSYRELCRSQDVSVNEAKEALSSYYRFQSRMKPGSIHATYLLSGVRKTVTIEVVNGIQNGHDEDQPMQSSPFDHVGGQPHEVEVERFEKIILVVGEENLEAAKETLEENASYHIYSLEPGVLNDLQVLTECNRRVTEQSATLDDPLLRGSIRSSRVKRRDVTNSFVPPVSRPAQPPASSVLKKDQSSSTPKSTASDSAKADSKPSTSKKSTGKKGGADFFKSFTKVAPGDKNATLHGVSNAPKYDSSSGDDDDDDPILPASSKQRPAKDRKQVHENLREMMNKADEPTKATPASSNGESSDSDEQEEEEEPKDEPMEDEPALSAQAAPKAEESSRVEVLGGRRRGKRKVMKTKTYKDEDGFLVTKEEPVWESFSEDDVKPAAVPSRPRPGSQQGSKAKPGAGKKGEKPNIASFFKRK